MKETAGLEFKFGIKYQDARKQKIRIYELGKRNRLTSTRRGPGIVAHVKSTTQFN
jgi:hypothetical protein